MTSNWRSAVGGLSVAYGLFIGFAVLNMVREAAEKNLRFAEMSYAVVSVATSIALITSGIFLLRRNVSAQSTRMTLYSSAVGLLVKSLLAGVVIVSVLRNPTGPLDGMIVMLIPLAIVPGLLWAFVLFVVGKQIDRPTSIAAHSEDEHVTVVVPKHLTAEVESLIERDRKMN